MRKYFNKRGISLMLAACLTVMSAVIPATANANVCYAAEIGTNAEVGTESASEPLVQPNSGATTANTANASIPAIADLKAQALATANYILGQTDFSDLTDTSKFYNASRNLILCIRCGADCTTAINTYLTAVKQRINADGTLNVLIADYGYPNDIYSSYAYLLIVLALTNNEATDFNGTNLVLTFNNILRDSADNAFLNGYDTVNFTNTGINPYHIGTINSACVAYKDSMPDYAGISAKLKNALTTLTSEGKGIDYYGLSADNNAVVYPHFINMYNTDATVKSLIDNVLSYTETTFFDKNDGTTHTIYNDYMTGTVIDEPSPNSTALSLAFYAQFGKTELAAKSYNALMTYKSTVTPGAFTYYGSDNLYAAQDALIGLTTYMNALENKNNPFNVSEEVKLINNLKSPNTGDNSPVLALMTLMLMSAVVILRFVGELRID